MAAHELVGVSSATSSAGKSTTAACPPGKQVVGAAGTKTSAVGGQVLLSAIRPEPALTSVTVSAVEDENGYPAGWAVSAYAVCATPLPGLQRITATSPTSSSNKSMAANCPPGTKLLAPGGQLNAGGGQVSMAAIRPRPDLTGAVVMGQEDGNGYGGSWSVTAYAVCATPPAGLQRVAATSATNSSDKHVPANCPAGKGLLGSGGEIGGGGGQVALDLLPTPFPGDPVGVDARAFEDENGHAGNWTVTAYAICAATSRREVARTLSDSNNKSATAPCPAGKQATGGGGEITGGVGQVVMNAVTPGFTGGVSASGFEDDTGFAGNWSARAYAICATPLPGLETVTAFSGFDTNPSIPAASCPAGKKVVAAEGALIGAGGEVIPVIIAPFPALTDVFVVGVQDQDGAGGAFWGIEATAICANPPRGLQLVQATSPSDSDPASVTASCPPGKNLLGGGGAIGGGGSSSGEVMMDDIRPDPLLTSMTVTGLEDETGTDLEWSVDAIAICASP